MRLGSYPWHDACWEVRSLDRLSTDPNVGSDGMVSLEVARIPGVDVSADMERRQHLEELRLIGAESEERSVYAPNTITYRAMAMKCSVAAATTKMWKTSWYENTLGHSRGRLVTRNTIPTV